jgi:hypothetical protein
MKQQEIEDLEKFETLKFGKENDLWIEDFYSLGNFGLVGGHEHTLVLNTENKTVYKSNNLMNSRYLVSNVIEKVQIHNELFPETKYTIIGFTGIDNGEFRTPHIEVVLNQTYFPNLIKAEPIEINLFIENLGFRQTTPESYVNDKYLVFDLYPRNVLKNNDGNLVVVDAEFRNLKKLEEEEKELDLKHKKIDLKKAFDLIKTSELKKPIYLTIEHSENSKNVMNYINKIDYSKIDWNKEIERQKINAIDN